MPIVHMLHIGANSNVAADAIYRVPTAFSDN